MKKGNKNLRVPYALSYHGKAEADAVLRVINEHRTMKGTETRAFEAKVAGLFGKKYGVMVNSGSSANLLAVEILNLPPGSEVITPALTFITTVAPLIQKGLVPVFVDVEPRTFLPSISAIEKKITRRTRALMIPHLIGNVPDMKKLRALADKHKLYLVEDSCDTIGAKFLGKSTGAYSHISTTSFYGSHIINGAGGGGMVCVNDPAWYKNLLVLRGWGRSSSLFDDSEEIEKRFNVELAGIRYDSKFIFTEFGYNFLPLELSAAFASVQLRKLPRFMRIRRKNFNALRAFFAKFPQYFDVPEETKGAETNWLAYAILFKDNIPFSRIQLATHLERQNIQTRPIFTGNILRQPVFTASKKGGDYPGYASLVTAGHTGGEIRVASLRKQDDFPGADYVMRNGLLVGCHQSLTPRHIQHITKAVESFVRGHGRQV